MEDHRYDTDQLIVFSPAGRPGGRVVVGALRAGALGVLDLGGSNGCSAAEIRLVTRRSSLDFGVRITHREAGSVRLPEAVTTLVLGSPDLLTDDPVFPRFHGRRLVEVVSLEEARAAVAAGADGLIAKGSESGGRVGEESCFVLLQRLLREVEVPVWALGGIGLHTAGAALATGARGVVLDAQVALTTESDVCTPWRRVISAMDGSETVVVDGVRGVRIPGAEGEAALIPVGQDAAFAASLAATYRSVGGVVQAVRDAATSQLGAAVEHEPLAPGNGVSRSFGTRYPIAQGPMTRVSDRPAFAAAVARGGGLPFLALSLMPGDEARTMMEETRDLVGANPWGAGMLGFADADLREKQLEAIRAVRPPYVLIAGGRPSQAAPLEDDGIPTYLHVPSPGLLDQFLQEGARRFVFEGRECGGHVGPRSSFVLWEQQVGRLLAEADLDGMDVLFAGGIHDARSAAAAAVVGAPLAARGARVGVLMGTAYLFTEEATETRAITEVFQEAALACESTVLVETAPGHATRCAESDFVAAFRNRRTALEEAGVPHRERWAELEKLNLGRLRIASRGLVRKDGELTEVDSDEIRHEGMFMLGDVASLRSERTTIEALHHEVSAGATELLADHDLPAEARPAAHATPIAIIGAACAYPGADGLDQFWANVLAGTDAITEVPADRWDIDRFFHPSGGAPDGRPLSDSKWGGFLPDLPFDPLRYGIPPRSLGSIGTDQLISLEVARRALADAGYAERPFDRERAAVVFGAEAGTDLAQAYGTRTALAHFADTLPPELDAVLPELTEDSFPGVLSNVIAGRIANRLDLGGANYTVDAACGSSLAALAAACQELGSRSADVVLCGAVDLHNGIHDYVLFTATKALSPTGRCRPFDAAADGIALGEGAACVVLKRLADAERDGDRILAVIDGVAAASDGRSLGLTAPRTEGQRRALDRAYERAGIGPRDIGLVEAHGTGTVVGDRTELTTLTDLYAGQSVPPGSVSLGSVKSQIGHTKCAAGMAGLLKAVLAVHHGVLPPTVISSPNPAWDAETSPFVFNDRPRVWLEEQRRAAVSAFGFGGANFHAVVSGYLGGDEAQHGADAWPAELFLFHGDAEGDLGRELDHLADLLTAVGDAGARPIRLRDIAHTFAQDSARGKGRPVRAALVADDLEDLRSKVALLRAGTPGDGVFLGSAAEQPRVGFLFPGQGSQRVHMAGDLLVAFPAVRHHLAAADAALAATIFPPTAFDTGRARQARALTDTRVAQPALGVVELAISELLERVGVMPDAAAGHSFGELTALAVAGALPAAALADLAAARGRAILAASPADDPGTMAAVRGSAVEVAPLLTAWPGVVVANDNSPTQCVISGPTAAVEAAAAGLSERGFPSRQIPVACGFHTPVLAAASAELADRLAGLDVAAPRIPVWSNTTAAPYPMDADAVRALLAGQVTSPVRFREQVESMYDAGIRVFVEAGPGRVLTQLVGAILGDRPHHVVPVDVPGEHGVRRLLLALAELATLGVPVDVEPLFAGRDVVTVDPATARPAPYLLNGALVRHADGSPVIGSLRPASEHPTLEQGAPLMAAAADDRAQLVEEYLRGMRTMAESQRDVMLALLGGVPQPAAPVAAPAAAPAAVEAAAPAPLVVVPEQVRPAVEAALGTVAPEAAPATRGARTVGDLLAAIVAIVAERTGYPEEMITPDLDLEAELSIDSIKRVEIIGELGQRIGLPGTDDAGGREAVIEELSLAKTVRAMAVWIASRDRTAQAPTAEPAAAAATVPAQPATAGSAPDGETTADIALARYVPRLAAAPEPTELRSLAGEQIAIVGGEPTLNHFLNELLVDEGAHVELATATGSPALGTTLLLDLSAIAPATAAEPTEQVVQHFERLRAAATSGVRELVVVTPQGGGLGLEGTAASWAHQASGAAATAMVKTIAREYTELRSRVIDIDLGGDPHATADRIAAALRAVDAPFELGLRADRNVTLTTQPYAATAAAPLGLGTDSVVLVTGGARGIAATCALGLARRHGCHIELLGRSPLPGAEDPELAGALDAGALRRLLLSRGGDRRPAEIEAEVARVLAAREIAATITALEEHAASVTYRSVDVADADALGRVLDGIRQRHGRLDGVVHAAGVREDKLVRDKTPESFTRVFGTKVPAARVLADALDSSGFLVLFASVAGYFGNVGQVDYAAANAALDAVARASAADGPRVVAFDWGPWGEGGMVTPELADEYARRGIGLISPEDGVAVFLDELERGLPEREVVVMCADLAAMEPASGRTPVAVS